MRELDLMLERVLDELYPQLPAALQDQFTELLQQTDQDLIDWISGRATPPPVFAELVTRMQQRLACDTGQQSFDK